MQPELLVIPVTVLGDTLKVLLTSQSREELGLPCLDLGSGFGQAEALLQAVKAFLPLPDSEFAQWTNSKRYRGRVVEVFDRPQSQKVTVVRAIAVPQDVAIRAKGEWCNAEDAALRLQQTDAFAATCLQTCLENIPFWARMSAFVFEVLPAVFSIQDLRLLVSNLSHQEVDAGNFHRRLKRLDILNPLVAGQRVHRWEFNWTRSDIVKKEGLLP